MRRGGWPFTLRCADLPDGMSTRRRNIHQHLLSDNEYWAVRVKRTWCMQTHQLYLKDYICHVADVYLKSQNLGSFRYPSPVQVVHLKSSTFGYLRDASIVRYVEVPKVKNKKRLFCTVFGYLWVSHSIRCLSSLTYLGTYWDTSYSRCTLHCPVVTSIMNASEDEFAFLDECAGLS